MRLLASCAYRVCRLSVSRLVRLSSVCLASCASRVLCVSRLVRLASCASRVSHLSVSRLVRLASCASRVLCVSRLVRLASRICLTSVVLSRVSRRSRVCLLVNACGNWLILCRSSFKEFNASELISLKMSTRHIIPLLFI